MRIARRLAVSFLLLATLTRAGEPRPPTLAELYSEEDIHDTAISPSGRYLAVALRQPTIEVIVGWRSATAR